VPLFKRRKDVGPILLAVWLVATGVSALAPIPFASTITAVLAIAVGVVILLER
jgi:uncharacterized protein (DUF697 family)